MPIEPGELAPGLSLSIRPRGLALHAGNRRLALLPLPARPSQARRVGAHAILALGKHGLWVVRVTADRRLKVLHTLYPGPKVDSFEISGDRVFPTTGKARVRISAKPPSARHPPKGPLKKAPPPAPSPFADLVPDEQRRMAAWPRPRPLTNGWLKSPTLFFEFNLPAQGAIDPWRSDNSGTAAPHPNAEVTLRLGYHLFRGHVLGLAITYSPDDGVPKDREEEERIEISSFHNPLGFFYRYAIPRTPLGVQVEPIRVVWAPDQGSDFGLRGTLQIAKHTAPARIGLELHLDLTARLVRLSLALVLGVNF